jgi:hypothetical protein
MGGKENVLWLHERFLELFRQKSNSWMVEELEQVMRELRQQVVAEQLP